MAADCAGSAPAGPVDTRTPANSAGSATNAMRRCLRRIVPSFSLRQVDDVLATIHKGGMVDARAPWSGHGDDWRSEEVREAVRELAERMRIFDGIGSDQRNLSIT
ncbi:hypothetical protein Misp05_13740 [Micromonospora sp. NBRC 107095]|nr:hypothetical protein Misp05_13740 [Micromonospora sp. NBRC 107095]